MRQLINFFEIQFKRLFNKITITLIISLLININLFSQVRLKPRLVDKLNSSLANEYIRVLCLLKDRVNMDSLSRYLYDIKATPQERAYIVITSLQSKAEATQTDLKQFLQSRMNTNYLRHFETFWITNLILVEGTPDLINELIQRNDIELMDLDGELRLDTYEFVGSASSSNVGAEPNLRVIRADELWKLGITGKGRLVMNIDTGVDGSHPALQASWRGNFVPANQAWFDPETNSTFPIDTAGHGTHILGIICGRAGFDTIGVAPDAQWIAAKAINDTPITHKTIMAFQWAMDPDGNPSTINDMPDVINNSWSDSDTTTDCESIYKPILDALELVGIAVIFSAGNRGPLPSSITAPKNINTNIVNVFSVGNFDFLKNTIDRQSSRGPSKCGGTGSLLIKPEVVAPGVSINSSIPGGGYVRGVGTSMAAAHVSGAVALLKQAFPNKTGKEILEALYYTAIDLGEDGEDNTYGKGLIDVYAAFLYLLGGNEDSQIIYTENRFENENAGGTISINDIEYPSGSWVALNAGDYVFRTNNERFVNYKGRGFTIKHNNWSGVRSKFYLVDTLSVDTTNSHIAYFLKLHYAKINNNLEGNDMLNLGTIGFQDPWYVLRDGSQPGNYWITSEGYYEPTGKEGAQEKGVFLNQGWPTWKPPYYSVRVGPVQWIELPHTGRGHFFYFQGWSASPDGSAEFKNANALETPVVFKQANAIVNANYKGSMLSSSTKALSSTSQRKVVRTPNGHLHIVYESMGKLWYQKSVNNGSTWYAPKLISYPDPEIISKNPFLTFYGNTLYLVFESFNVNEGGGVIDLYSIDQNGNITNLFPYQMINIEVESHPSVAVD